MNRAGQISDQISDHSLNLRVSKNTLGTLGVCDLSDFSMIYLHHADTLATLPSVYMEPSIEPYRNINPDG